MSTYKWAGQYGGEWENYYNWRDDQGNNVYQYPGQFSGQGDIVYFDTGGGYYVYSNNPYSDLYLQAVYFANATSVDFQNIRFSVDTGVVSALYFGKDGQGDTSNCYASFGNGGSYPCKLTGYEFIFAGQGFTATISSNYGEVDSNTYGIYAAGGAALYIGCVLAGYVSLTVSAEGSGTNLTVAGTVVRPDVSYRVNYGSVMHFATTLLGTGGSMHHAGGSFDFTGQGGIPWTAFTQMIMGDISLQGIASGEGPAGKGVNWQLFFALAPYALSPYMGAGDSLTMRDGGRLNMVQDDTLTCNLSFQAGEHGTIKYY